MNWETMKPDNRGQNLQECGYMSDHPRGTWYATNCDIHMAYICEKDSGSGQYHLLSSNPPNWIYSGKNDPH